MMFLGCLQMSFVFEAFIGGVCERRSLAYCKFLQRISMQGRGLDASESRLQRGLDPHDAHMKGNNLY